MIDPSKHLTRAIIAVAMACAIAIVSFVVLWGWFNHQLWATTFHFGSATMKANTAVGFIVCTVGLAGIKWRRHGIHIGSGLLLMLLGATTILEYVAHIDLGIDQLLAYDIWQPNHPGRMSPGTAVCFVFAGAMLAVHNTYPQRHINRYDALVTAFLAIPLFVFFCYIFAPDEVINTPLLETMPFHTSINFLLFFFATSFLTHSKGAAGLFNRNTRNAQNFRLLFFLILILPLCLGSVLKYGVQNHWIGTGIGIAIFCLFSTLIVASALAHHTILLDHWFRQLLQERRKSHLLKHQIHELLEIAADGILLFDGNLLILHANSGAERILGYPPQELSGMYLEQLLPAHQSNTGYMEMDRYIDNKDSPATLNIPDSVLLRHKDGHELAVSVSLSKKVHSDQTLLIAIIKNITKLDNKIKNLEKKARTDPLTQTLNRAEFEVFCERINWQELRKSDDSFCVMLLDIDDFKQINDEFGHNTGDEVLKSFAKTVQNVLREGDRLFRTGGEEFVIVTTNLTTEDAFSFAERIRIAVQNNLVEIDGKELKITCSIGVCIVDSTTKNIMDAVKYADEAMYQAKHSGKNCSVTSSYPKETQSDS